MMMAKTGFTVGLLVITTNIEWCVMFVLMMAEVMSGFFLLVAAIVGRHRPGDLERQQEHQNKD